MILNEFIDKIFNRYKCTAPDLDDKKEEYTSVLISKCDKVDFQKLLDMIAREHESDFIPSASKVLEWSVRCYKTSFKKTEKQWLHVKVFNPIYNCVTNNDCFPAGTTEEQMLKVYQKMFPNTQGWRIVEVY